MELVASKSTSPSRHVRHRSRGQLILVQILIRNIVFRYLMGVHFPRKLTIGLLRSIELLGTRVAPNVRKQLTTVLSHGVS